jgi:hypothetical protein
MITVQVLVAGKREVAKKAANGPSFFALGM